LPEYLAPSAYVLLQEFPRTSGGKVDKKALPAPDAGRPELAESFVPPETSVEAVLAGIWSEVLGVDKVGVHDNFFELGGNSFLLVRVQSLLATALAKPVPIAAFFLYPTVRGLADSLNQATGEPAAMQAATARAEARRGSLRRNPRRREENAAES
jgi:hypothetical protein